MLNQESKSGQSEFVGKPNVFVSHAFSYEFLDTVDALVHHLKDELEDAILWWDLFTINQHLDGDWTFECLSNAFRSAIQKDIQRVVMVMSPWNDPVTYQRAWCIFEAYCAISANNKTHHQNNSFVSYQRNSANFTAYHFAPQSFMRWNFSSFQSLT